MSDPKIDPERMKQWESNILPVPSAERLKGKGPSPSACSPSCGRCRYFKRSSPTAKGGKCGHGSGMMSVRDTFKCQFFEQNAKEQEP